jgi:glycosyltransferase involved in cell wall biosynthesis
MTVSLTETASPQAAKDDVYPRESTAERTAPYAVEFAGWLPCFEFFGNCGQHPQFSHTDAPPAGYRFVRSEPEVAEGAPERQGLGAVVAKILRAAWLAVRPLCSVVLHARDTGVGRSLRTFGAVVRLFFTLRRAGCRLGPSVQFLRTRHFASQVLVPPQANLLFVTSVPYTLGQRPWVIEIEDPTTLFYPHHMNGCTSRTPVRRSPYVPIVKALLESDACRGVITHMRSTAEALPKLFRSEIIAAKTAYVPCGTALPPAHQDQAATDRLDLLFTCSWHQDPDSFFLRGGLDVLRSFETLQERYPHVRLTLRTRLPRLAHRFRKVMEKGWVRVIDRYLPDEDMDELMRSSHVFLLPAARIHVVSVLRAMAYGQVVVASDGWGFREYVEHGRNGLIVPGRHGVASWMDEETGMLRENYSRMFSSSTAVSGALVEAVSRLVEDHELRRRLGAQARQDVATRYTLENWNRGLKEALDRAVGRTA